jgi:hypothetical protein
MSRKVVKRTADYIITERGDKRYAVKSAKGGRINGEEKVKVLLAEGLIKLSKPGKKEAPKEEAPAADAPAADAAAE